MPVTLAAPFENSRSHSVKASKTIGVIIMVALGTFVATNAVAKDRTTGRGKGPVVYVESQGLFFDSIVVTDHLPFAGNFQELKPGEGPSGLATEFGPGDVGYLGGRWWVDGTMNGYMDDEDVYFLCPLLGPGRGSL